MIAIVSDIHGNLPALESVMDDIKNFDVSAIYSLGDVCGYYPFINETIDILREKNCVNLIGNHDRYIIDDTECPRSTSANSCLAYQKSVISSENKEWLKKSISSYKTQSISMVHGGWNDPEDEYIYRVKNEYFQNLSQKYFFCGHTHVQRHLILDSKKEFINPGSVGQPRDGNKNAAYCLFDTSLMRVFLRRVEYDIDIVSAQMEKLGFEKWYYENLYNGTRIGGKIDKITYFDNRSKGDV